MSEDGVAGTESEASARAQAESAAGAGFIAKLAERIGERAGVSAVFGDPVERDGATVIPVARAAWGVGGGAGEEEGKEGFGGGGGGYAAPIGFIEISGGSARFRPLPSPLRTAGRLAAGAGLCATAIAIAALLRPRRERPRRVAGALAATSAVARPLARVGGGALAGAGRSLRRG